ncbi:MAG: RsmE family RNA methyltransferase [Opitutales bacterium]
MNLILFDRPFKEVCLEAADPRAAHIRKVLRAEMGRTVFIGFANGVRARAEVVGLAEDGGVELVVTATEPAPPALPIRLVVGLPRPHTARRILFEAASMGVGALHFFESEKGEPSYADSRLWQTDEWRERLRLGAEQSFGTYLPEVTIAPDLQTAITQLSPAGVCRALDHYEASGPLGGMIPGGASQVVLGFGSERGWSADERATLRRNGWKLAHMGPFVMRLETACTAAVSVAASAMGSWAV